jgi:hypothetical protein
MLKKINYLIPNKFKRTAWWLIFTNLGFFGIPIGVFILFLMWLQKNLNPRKNFKYYFLFLRILENGVIFTSLLIMCLCYLVLLAFMLMGIMEINAIESIKEVYLSLSFLVGFLVNLIAIFVLYIFINTNNKYIKNHNFYALVVLIFAILIFIYSNIFLYSFLSTIITKFFVDYSFFLLIAIVISGIIITYEQKYNP